MSVVYVDFEASSLFDHIVKSKIALFVGKTCFYLWCGSVQVYTFKPKALCLL